MRAKLRARTLERFLIEWLHRKRWSRCVNVRVEPPANCASQSTLSLCKHVAIVQVKEQLFLDVPEIKFMQDGFITEWSAQASGLVQVPTQERPQQQQG
jgi:hypothetical protein